MTEITQADRELLVKLVGYDSETSDQILAGKAFTWEVEQVARHRMEECARIVAWLRKEAIFSTDTVRRRMNETLDQIEAGEHLK